MSYLVLEIMNIKVDKVSYNEKELWKNKPYFTMFTHQSYIDIYIGNITS